MAEVKRIPKAILRELETASRAVVREQAKLDDAIQRRDRAVLAATDAGMSRRQIAEVTGITFGRVQQVLARHRSA